jgi:hypothetical protein
MPSSFQSNTEALIAILEECLELTDGHPFRGADALIQYLADMGLMVVRKDGWGVTTDKDKLALREWCKSGKKPISH